MPIRMGTSSSSSGPSTERDTPGREAVHPDPTRILVGRMQHEKCSVSSLTSAERERSRPTLEGARANKGAGATLVAPALVIPTLGLCDQEIAEHLDTGDGAEFLRIDHVAVQGGRLDIP